MSYDFFVFPAEAADDLSAATRLYESAPARGSLTPGGRVAAFLASVGAAGLEALGTRRGGAGAHVVGRPARPPDGRRGAGPAARPVGARRAAHRAHDPRGAVDVRLLTEAGPCLPFLTRAVLREVLGHLADRRYSWARVGGTQVSYDGDSFLVDAAVSSGDLASVEELLWSAAVSAAAGT